MRYILSQRNIYFSKKKFHSNFVKTPKKSEYSKKCTRITQENSWAVFVHKHNFEYSDIFGVLTKSEEFFFVWK